MRNQECGLNLFRYCQRGLRRSVFTCQCGIRLQLVICEMVRRCPASRNSPRPLAVSRVTVRRGLDALAQGGFIERRAGSGTKVRARPAVAQRAAMNFNTLMPQLVEMGQKTTARLLSFTYGGAPDFVSLAMGFERDIEVQIATRVRLAGNVPFSHLTTYVPAQIAQNYSENDLATTPLFQLLERSGVQIKEAHQSVSATLAGPEVAKALDVEVGSRCCHCGGLCGMCMGRVSST